MRTSWTLFSPLSWSPSIFQWCEIYSDTVCIEVTHSILAIPSCPPKITLYSSLYWIKHRFMYLAILFFTRNVKRRIQCLESKRICCPPETWLLHPSGLWNWKFGKHDKQPLDLAGLIAKSFISISAKELTPPSFLEGWHWLTAHFSYQGALSSWKISSLQFPFSGPGWPTSTPMWCKSCLSSKWQTFNYVYSFQAFFSFFLTMLNFPKHFIYNVGPKPFHIVPFFFECTSLTDISLNLALAEWFPGLQIWFD